jgi:hypothetical protein
LKTIRTFIHLEGILYESLEFEYRQGYETRTALRGVNETNSVGVTALLADDNDEPLVSMTPDIRFPMGCAPGMPTVGLHDLRVSLPMHPDARAIQLRAQDRLLFEQAIGDSLPSELVIETKPAEDGDSVSVTLKGPRQPDSETAVFLEVERRRRFPIRVDNERDNTLADLKPYAGLGEARFVVRHSRAFRSSVSKSEKFMLPERVICGHILKPRGNVELRPSFPFSMLGTLCDQNGRLIEWKDGDAYWCVDGERLADERQIALCAPLKPGEHSVELCARDGADNPQLLQEMKILVKEKSKKQLEYEAIVEEYLGSKRNNQSRQQDS